MNRGLIVGNVFKDGIPVSGVDVIMRRITTSEGLLDVEINNEGLTNSKGQFAIPFGWYGDQFADTLLWMEIILIAIKKHRTTPLTSWYETGKATIRGYLIRDVESLFGVAVTNISDAVQQQNDADLLTFTTSFKKHWGKMSVVLSRYRTAVLSTESWMIIGAGNIYIK
jgi:hypothetical protein